MLSSTSQTQRPHMFDCREAVFFGGWDEQFLNFTAQVDQADRAGLPVELGSMC